MTPQQAISALDRALAAHGTDAVLRRWTGTGPARTHVDVTVRVRAEDYQPAELVGGIMQGDTRVIMSPSQVIAAAWPGPQDWPRIGDKLVIDGPERNIEAAPPVRIGGVVVRLNLQVRG